MKTTTILKEFWKFARQYKKYYIFSTVLMFLTLFFDLARPFILKATLDRIRLSDLTGMQHFACVFLLVIILSYIFKSGFHYLLTTAFLHTIYNLRNQLFKHILHLKMAYFDTHPVGSLLTRTVNDTESLRELLHAGVTTILVDILMVFGLGIVMIKLDIYLSIPVIIVCPIIIILVKWFGKKLRDLFQNIRETMSRSNGFMSEAINGMGIIQLFHNEEKSAQTFEDFNATVKKAAIASNLYDGMLYALIDAIAFSVTAIVLYVGFGVRFSMTEVTSIIVYISLIEQIFIPIRDLGSKFATIQQALAALERIMKILFTPEYIPQGKNKIGNENIRITFDNVSFAYKEEGPNVIKNINFTVKPGEVVALVGATGSGKSTIGKLLNRFYDGYSGAITVGGVEISKSNYHSLRSRIATISQDVNIFPGTIRNNINMFHKNISDEKIYWAVEIVKAKELIENLPGKLDFDVKENGENLSAGQLQLIAFCRALVHEAPIILLDEATSSVDSVTEAWIQEALNEIFKLKTVIVIAHRLATIVAANKIIVMKNGTIEQKGDHYSLMQEEHGYYANLIKSSQISGKNVL